MSSFFGFSVAIIVKYVDQFQRVQFGQPNQISVAMTPAYAAPHSVLYVKFRLKLHFVSLGDLPDLKLSLFLSLCILKSVADKGEITAFGVRTFAARTVVFFLFVLFISFVSSVSNIFIMDVYALSSLEKFSHSYGTKRLFVLRKYPLAYVIYHK